MRSVSLRLVDLERNPLIPLGFEGENEYTTVRVDCKKIFDEHPNAVPTLAVTPPEGDSYPAVIVRDGDIVSWTVTDSDLVHSGTGEIQFAFVIDETIIGKTYKARTKVLDSITPSGEVPTPIQNWLIQAAAVLQALPTEVASSVAALMGAMVGVGETLDPDDDVTVNYDPVNNTLTIGVPHGRDGVDGHTPAITANKVGKVATFYVDGVAIVQISDGQDADPTELIDDTSTDQNRTWSAKKLDEENRSLKTEIMQTGAYYIDRNLFKNPTSVNSNASNVINAAIIDAQTKGLQYCVIPEGEYWITQTIYLKSDVILCGCGIDATTLKIADGCDIDAIRVAEPVNNSGLMDLAIDGNRIENYSVFVNGHHGNAINVWLHYGRIERVRTNWVFKHSLLLNYDTGNSDDGLGFAPEHQNDMGNLNKVLWCDFKDSLLQGVMWGWRTMDSWMCYTNIGSHAANLYLEGGTSRFIGNHFDGDGDNGSGPEYNIYCGDGCNAMVFEGNIFENTQKENIFFRQPSYSNQTMTITIANNIIRTCSKSQNEQYANIKISGYSSSVPAAEIVISGNQILNPDTNANHGYAGIHLLYCENSKVVGNTFFNVGDDEVLLDSTCENVLNDSKTVNDVQINGTSILDAQGVANVTKATDTSLGVVKGKYYGVRINADGDMYISKAEASEVKAGTSNYLPIVPSNQQSAVFYGLAKLAGADMASSSNPVGQFTDDALVKIQKMLGVYEAPWELIREDTVTNATEADVEIIVDGDGQAFDLTDVYLQVWTPQQETEASIGDYGLVQCFYTNNNYVRAYMGTWTQSANTSAKYGQVLVTNKNGAVRKESTQNATQFTLVNLTSRVNIPEDDALLKIGTYSFAKITIKKVTGTMKYKLYGRRKWN